MTARSMVGSREGRDDITLNHAKRIIGDGSVGVSSDSVRGFVEFVMNIHPDKSDADNSPSLGTNLPSIGQPVTPMPAKVTPEPICRDYALRAVEMNVEAQKLGCGFAPPVWSNDHEMHFQWCMHGGNAAQAGPENMKRVTALADCSAQKSAKVKPASAVCAVYASEAKLSSQTATALGCGFSGPRWLSDYNAHYNWCAGGVDNAVLLSEAASRAFELNACYETQMKR